MSRARVRGQRSAGGSAASSAIAGPRSKRPDTGNAKEPWAQHTHQERVQLGQDPQEQSTHESVAASGSASAKAAKKTGTRKRIARRGICGIRGIVQQEEGCDGGKREGDPRGSLSNRSSDHLQVLLPGPPLQLFEQHWLLLVQLEPAAPQEPPPGLRKAARLG